MLTHAIPPDFRSGVDLVIPPSAIKSARILTRHMIAYRGRSLPRVRRRKASCPQGSSSNEWCTFSFHHGPYNVRFSFPIPTIGMMRAVCATQKVSEANHDMISWKVTKKYKQ